MKKYFVSLGLIVTFGVYVLLLKQHDKRGVSAVALTPTASPSTSDSPSPMMESSPSPVTNVTPATPSPAPTQSLIPYKDGGYTGSLEDAFYGNVQVRATISNGKISDVLFLSYPNDRGHSVEVSNYAMPLLRTEAIQAQSSDVDIVSGATATSVAFTTSLRNALMQAH